MNNEYSEKLDKCRAQIDKIDDEILNLLKKRIEIVKDVKEIKSQNGEGFFVKSAREADMIKILMAKSGADLPKSAIASIWRKIITSSNILEQPLKIALHNQNHIADYKYILREYYADFVPIISHDSAQNVMMEIEKNQAQIAAFFLPKNDEDACGNWWINLASGNNDAKIFAKLPLLNDENSPNLVVLAKKMPEKSQKDITLLCVETSSEVSKSQLIAVMKECSIGGNIIKSSRMKSVENALFYLIEAHGYYDDKSAEIMAFSKSKIRPFVKILGCYPDFS